jgi:hypothetical protein
MYHLVGNAVPPPLSAALGRCLALAASRSVDRKKAVILPDDGWAAELRACKRARARERVGREAQVPEPNGVRRAGC